MEETELYDLITRLAAGNLNQAEKEQLSAYFKEDSGKDMLLAVLEKQLQLEDGQTAPFDEERYLPLLRDILDADKGAVPVLSIRRSRRRRWIWAAAAVLLLVGTTVVLIKTKRAHDEMATNGGAMADAAPGHSQAILTLSNGTKIVLDNTHNGTLAEEGSSRVTRTDSGRLAYTVVTGNGKEERSRGAGGSGSTVMWNELSTPRGGQYELSLSDGTKVWLNAASSIRYPAQFDGRDRVVSVSGEAYFEVARDRDQRAFRVKVNNMTVDVLGTRFNINAYTDERIIRTTLLEGSVRVSQGSSVVLHPGEQAGVDSSVTRIASVDLDEVMAWKNGLFRFRNADLPTVLRQLSRWYDLDIVFEGKVPDAHFEGKIPRDAMASQVLSLLEKNQVHFRIEGKKLYVKP